MDVLHEAVKMDALLARDLRGVEEQVHQHRFATPHRTHEIQPGRHIFLGMAPAHQPRQQSPTDRWNRLGFVIAQPFPQVLQALDRCRLRRIGRQRTGGDQVLVGWQRSGQLRWVGLAIHEGALEIACPDANA